MRKPQLLRDHLADAFPEFNGRARDRLAVYVENGRVRARPAPGTSTGVVSFEWAYRLEAVLLDFKGDANTVLALVLDWLRIHQPELLVSHEGSPVELQADIIDDERIDLQLSLELSEAVRRTEDGFEYLPEPAIDDSFEGIGDAVGLSGLVIGGEDLAS